MTLLLERRELLDGFRRGDRASLLEVYRHYVRDVARFLTRGFTFQSDGRPCSFRGFGGGYEIEAALQEVFRRAFEERARLAYNGIDPYRPYLLRIARNMVINDLKSRHPILFRFRAGRSVVLESAPEGAAEDELPAQDLGADEVLEAREVGRMVQAFKSALGAREAGVFRHRFEEGLSAEQAAERLGLTRSQVRTTEAKLRAAFLAHMRAGGYLEGLRAKAALAAPACALLALLMNGASP
jgi:RNA polymerase sigma-70 factor (ECF subfamily)